MVVFSSHTRTDSLRHLLLPALQKYVQAVRGDFRSEIFRGGLSWNVFWKYKNARSKIVILYTAASVECLYDGGSLTYF